MLQVLNFKEKLLFYFLLLVFIGSSISCGAVFYHSKTRPIPAYGGEYIEGIVGQPLRINPLFATSNEADADLSQLIYSGLFKYDNQNNLIPDLAEGYDISEDETTYTIHLKKNVLWHDDQIFNANDILFTINLISNPVYKSPLRSNWQGIETTIIDDYTIEFKIKNPYVGFLNNLTFGILPKHIWDSITADNFSLSSLNLKPIGTGPYKYSSIQKDSKDNILSYKLISNPSYFNGKPYISKITFNFYLDEESAVNALNRKEIAGINSISPERIATIKVQKSISIHKFDLPRYSAIFFNQTKSISLANDEVREALNYATDRQEIINTILEDNGQSVYSPFLPNMMGYLKDLEHPEFDLEKANKILDDKDWKKGEDGFRSKDGVDLKINLTTTDWDELVRTAEIIKSQWEKIGIKVDINSYSISDIRENYIRTREYDALLFGQALGADSDPYYFWHSDNKKDPGLNLSLFGNSDSDKLIEAGRIEFDAEKRSQNYIDFQKILNQENPAVFLYSPNYLYPVSKNVQGIIMESLVSSSKRFSDINHWYIKTKRVKK